MSEETLKTVIIKAVSDTDFRDLLFDDPGKALAEYDLSDEEVSKLKGMQRDKFDATAGELEERISRAGIGLADFDFATPNRSAGSFGKWELFFDGSAIES